MLNALLLSLHSCFEETMRASVVLLFAFLALTFVAAYAAVEVSDSIRESDAGIRALMQTNTCRV